MSPIADAYTTHRPWVWGIAYRMLGNPADADDVVQDTFARAVQHRPAPRDGLRPWLTRVATRLAVDRLRRRRRQHTATRGPAPWLPGPLPDADPRLGEPESRPADQPEARYGLRESATMAFLIAMEQLTPHQRAVLILRDVLDLTGDETAAALDSSPGGVRVALHRARRTMAEYDRDPVALDAAGRARAEALLMRFLVAVQSGDVAAVRALLTEDIVALSDGGGRYFAANRPVYGAERIARMYIKLARAYGPTSAAIEWVNGLPAIVGRTADPYPGHPSRSVTQLRLRGDRIMAIHAVLADDRLAAFG